MFRDRSQAGYLLAVRLQEVGEGGASGGTGEAGGKPLVLAVPRGGVVVAAAVCEMLGAPMDLAIAQKIGAPQNPELAVGAVAPDGSVLLDQDLCRHLDVSQQYLEQEREARRLEIEWRLRNYRGDRPLPGLAGRHVIVVDDGVATGLTTAAALRWVVGLGPRRVILAVPVAPVDTVEWLKQECDTLVCLETPESFWAVGQFYERFDQTTDREVVDLYQRHAE